MTWFETLTGFTEQSPQQVRSMLYLDGGWLVSRANGLRWHWGHFEAPTLQELRRRTAQALQQANGKLRLREQVADVRCLHADPENAHALFQVASQFNLLEMLSPQVTPEEGVGLYGGDMTQGPASAVAAGAGTIWRNYLMPLPRQTGQTADLQMDCLAGLGRALGNRDNRLWQMRNGYLIPGPDGLPEITRLLEHSTVQQRDALAGLIRVGIQSDTQVTLDQCSHRVNQVYCSALPVAYCSFPADSWAVFARFVLQAAYEATFHAALEQQALYGRDRLYLTLLGGGAFGNRTQWVMDALWRALQMFAATELEVVIVSQQRSSVAVRRLLEEFNND